MVFYVDPSLDRTVAPYRRTCGHEVEYSSGAAVATLLQEAGTGTPPRYGQRALHDYSCSCGDRDNYPIHTTSDSTAGGGEYIIGGSRGVLFGSDAYMKATKILSDAAIEIGCGTNNQVGMHTHVGIRDLDHDQLVAVLRTYVRYKDDIRKLAAGPMDEVRKNNGCTPDDWDLARFLQYQGMGGISEKRFWSDPLTSLRSMSLPSDGHIRFGTEHSTIEFRVWNSTKAQWRMVLAGAVSSAIVQAGFEGRLAHPDNPATFVEFLRGLLTPDVIVLIERQMKKAVR